jgi:hypothetical protein
MEQHKAQTKVREQVNVSRIALTGAAAAAIFYMLCWLGAILSLGPLSHMYLQLFTVAEMTSASALLQGTLWSFVFGLVAAGLFAIVYNILVPLERR